MSWEQFTVVQLKAILAENSISALSHRKQSLVAACKKDLTDDLAQRYWEKFQRRVGASGSETAHRAHSNSSAVGSLAELSDDDQLDRETDSDTNLAHGDDQMTASAVCEPLKHQRHHEVFSLGQIRRRSRSSVDTEGRDHKKLVNELMDASRLARQEYLARRVARKSLPISNTTLFDSILPRRHSGSETDLSFHETDSLKNEIDTDTPWDSPNPPPDQSGAKDKMQHSVADELVTSRGSVYVEQSPSPWIANTFKAVPQPKTVSYLQHSETMLVPDSTVVPHLTILYPKNSQLSGANPRETDSPCNLRKRPRDAKTELIPNRGVARSHERVLTPGLSQPAEMVADLFSGRKKMDGLAIGIAFFLVGLAVIVRSLGFVPGPDALKVVFCDSFSPSSITPATPCLPCPAQGICTGGQVNCGYGQAIQFSLMTGWTCKSGATPKSQRKVLLEAAVEYLDAVAGEVECGRKTSKNVSRQEMFNFLSQTAVAKSMGFQKFEHDFDIFVVERLMQGHGVTPEVFAAIHGKKPLQCVVYRYVLAHVPMFTCIIAVISTVIFAGRHLKAKWIEMHLCRQLVSLIENKTAVVTSGPERGYMRGPTAGELLAALNSTHARGLNETRVTAMCDKLTYAGVQKSMFATGDTTPFWFSHDTAQRLHCEAGHSFGVPSRRVRNQARDIGDPAPWRAAAARAFVYA